MQAGSIILLIQPHYFWSISLLFGITRYSGLMSYFPCPNHGICHFSKESWLFSVREWFLETKIWALGVLDSIVISLGPALPAELGNCVCVCFSSNPLPLASSFPSPILYLYLPSLLFSQWVHWLLAISVCLLIYLLYSTHFVSELLSLTTANNKPAKELRFPWCPFCLYVEAMWSKDSIKSNLD